MWLVLMRVLLGTRCGDRGYRPLADCSHQHWPSLCALLDVPTDTRIPSYSTFRRVLQHVDFAPLVTLFNQWRQHFIPVSAPTWVAADGNSIKSTLTDYSAADQNWVMTVSAFSQ
ncbi:transposase family protein [Trichothermofontia sichuanensis]|uniref:transposase family protein n=1 Tax=Trichothermofontia sichuanensis TaxID=3045816 RepID=UPI002574F20A|nr:transposase family protein [Trichothermofontia sichuanensis]